MRVAILGTGKMGTAIAQRLRGMGHELVLWNRTRSRAEAVGTGKVASTPAEAVAEADVVISILTDADAVRAAYLGDHGAVQAARNQVFVDMTTAGPDVVKELLAAIERTGAKFIECPVMGSIGAMATGKGVLFAAGDKEAVERARPVLEALGEVRLVNDPENAAKLKLVANTILMDISAVGAEVLAAGSAAGLNPEDVFWVLTRFAPPLAARRAGFIEHRHVPVTFAVRDAAKDLRLATDVYRKAGAWTPITDTAKELYDRVAKSAADLEMSAIVTVYEKPASEPKG